MNNINSNERWDDLELDGLGVIQAIDGYSFTSDSVLLANFIKAGRKDKVIELCAGSGVISLIMGYKRKPKSLTLVEIQESQADRARRSFLLNNMEANIINDRLQEINKKVGAYSFDVCFANPPYRKKSNDFSNLKEIAISTHEIEVNLSELVTEAEKLLKFGGRFYVIYPVERLAELFYELVKNKLEPKEMVVIYPKEGRPAELVIVSATKGAKHGLKLLEPIIQNDKNGKPTEIMKSIYNSR